MKKLTFLVVALFIVAIPLEIFGAKRKNSKKPELSVEYVANKIDSLSALDIDGYLNQDSTAMHNSVELNSFILSLPKSFKREILSDLYLKRIEELSDTGNPDSILPICVAATAIPDTTVISMACEGIVQVMGFRSDTDGMKKAINRISLVADTSFVNQLAKEYDDILNPIPFESLARGTWVSTNLMCSSFGKRHFPYYIFTINDLNDGGITLCNIPGETNRLESYDISNLRHSQILGGSYGNIIAAFGSENLKRGNDILAQQGFEMTRKFRAESRATINTSKASFGDRLVAGVTTEVVAGLLDGLFSSTAQSYKHVAALNLDLRMENPGIMYGNAEYYNYHVSTNNMYYKPTPIKQSDVKFAKWLPEDSVYFVNSKNKIFSITPQITTPEYDAIMSKYSYKRAKYWVPTTVGIVGGAALMAAGYAIAFDCNKYDEYGNKIYDSNGKPELNSGKLVGGIIMALVGEVVGLAVPMLVYQHRVGKRDKALSELNEKQMRRLEHKAMLRFAPAIDTQDQGLGIHASLTF